MTTRIRQTYRISPISALKLKVLSATMKTPMSHLIDIMVDELWKQKENQVSTITDRLISKEVRKILRKVIVE